MEAKVVESSVVGVSVKGEKGSVAEGVVKVVDDLEVVVQVMVGAGLVVVVVPVIREEGSVVEVRVKEVVDWVVGVLEKVEAGLAAEVLAMEAVG